MYEYYLFKKTCYGVTDPVIEYDLQKMLTIKFYIYYRKVALRAPYIFKFV